MKNPSKKQEYFIYCDRHQRKGSHALLFWRPDGKGYTENLNEAGLYLSDFECIDKFLEAEKVESLAVIMMGERKACLIVENKPANRIKLGIKKKDMLSGGYGDVYQTPELFFREYNAMTDKMQSLFEIHNQQNA